MADSNLESEWIDIEIYVNDLPKSRVPEEWGLQHQSKGVLDLDETQSPFLHMMAVDIVTLGDIRIGMQMFTGFQDNLALL